MAEVKVLYIDVQDGELDELNDGLRKTKKSIDSVEGSSKKADNAIKKVGENGGAIATLDSITGGLATRIRDAAEATKVFNFNLKGVQTALIATGIGAFVVALGFVVAYWEDIVDLITGASRKLEDHVSLIEKRFSVLEAELAILDEQLKINTLQNTEVQAILDKKRELLKLQLEELRIQKLILEEQFAREASEARRAKFLEVLLGIYF